MHKLAIDRLKCNDCKKCNHVIPGFSYREFGLMISPKNFRAYESSISEILKVCSNDAIAINKMR